MRTRSGARIGASPFSIGLVAIGLVCALVAGWLLLGRDKPTVPPKTWAKAVCTALTPWRTRVADLTAAAQQEITGTGTPAETKRTLTTLLAGAEEASERARTRVADAGVPDVDQGAAVARQFATALTSARDAYGHAKTAVGQLPTVEAATFYDGVSAAFVTLNEEYGASELDISAVGPEPLRRSFDEVPECQ